MSEFFYGGFYRFQASPFHITPDASLLFLTQTHQQAMGTVEYGIAAGKGFIVITGEVGVGKTTVLRAVLDRLDPAKYRIIYLFNPNATVPELYASILEGLDYSIERPGDDPAKTLRALQHAVLDHHQRGVEVVLAVDEAQNMPEATLEHLRILSNLETAKSKLLQIILVGQPELDEMLRRRSLRQLAQRIAVRARIDPLGFMQSCRYVQHRLICAGRPTEPPLFTLPAMWYMALRARGIPRSLNIYADNALINGYGHHADRITLKILRESLRPLRNGPHPLKRVLAWAAAGVVLIAVGIGIFRGLTPGRPTTDRPLPPPPGAALKEVPSAPPSAVSAAVSPQPPNPAAQQAVPAAASPAPAVPASAPPAAAPPPVPQAAPPAGAVQDAASPEALAPASGTSATRVPDDAAHDAAPLKAKAADSAAPTRRKGGTKKWLVRRGDTLIKVCRRTYGGCAPAKLKEIYAFNPTLNAQGAIRPGDVIVLPDKAAPRPN